MKTLTGKVVSCKMQKTAVVEVVRFVAHPMYQKRIRNTKKFHAHCEIPVENGDTVKLSESKPISKTKNWTVIKVLKGKNGTT